MIIPKCPHCGAQHVQAAEEGPAFTFNADQPQLLAWRVARCQNLVCKKLILAALGPRGEIMQIYPPATFELDSQAGIPQPLRDDYREAGTCLGAGCPKASMVMARRALQRMLKEQGCDQKQLVDAIAHAVKSGVLRRAFHDLAEEVRHYGNLGAHPDDEQLENATTENAETLLSFVRMLAHEYYEVPAEAARLKAARQKNKKPAA